MHGDRPYTALHPVDLNQSSWDQVLADNLSLSVRPVAQEPGRMGTKHAG